MLITTLFTKIKSKRIKLIITERIIWSKKVLNGELLISFIFINNLSNEYFNFREKKNKIAGLNHKDINKKNHKKFKRSIGDALWKSMKFGKDKKFNFASLNKKNNERIDKSQPSIKHLLGILVQKRKKQSCSLKKKVSRMKSSKMRGNWLNEERLSEEEKYSINPFKIKLTPMKLRDRAATLKGQEIPLVTMNDISGLD